MQITALFNRNQISASMSRFLNVAADLRQWWVDEFLTLLPSRVAQWMFGGRQVVVLQQISGEVKLSLADRTEGVKAAIRTSALGYSKLVLEQFFKDHKMSREDVDIAVRIPVTQFFCRELLLPVETLPDLDTIVAQDLTRKTPFRLDGVYHHHAVERQKGQQKILVRQWVIKRDVVDAALSFLQLDARDVDFIEADDRTSQFPKPFIALKKESRRKNTWPRHAIRALLISLCILSVIAIGGRLWRQQSSIGELDLKIATARLKAQQVRTRLDGVEKKQAAIMRLREQKSFMPGVLDIWEETTLLLPQNAWLTELQLSNFGKKEERKVSWVGFSEAAASLVGQFAKSQIFREVSLTSPITTDPLEGRERFSMQAKIVAGNRGKPER